MKRLILPVIFLIVYGSTTAQQRVERPLQVHLNGSGLFLKALGNSLADSEVNDLAVKDWGLPGISVGYHLNKRVYVGYAFVPNRNLILKESWSFGPAERDGNISVDHNSGVSHSLEGRFFPFDFGLYGAAFFTHISKADYQMDFERMDAEMIIGNNAYATDVEANWNFKSLTTVGLGLGYNYVHKSGVSFDLGIGVPIPFSSPLHENIVIESVQGVAIGEEDLAFGKEKLENETFYFPMQFHLNVGYNFKVSN